MIFSYGVTQQGHYHIKNGTPCQDAHEFKLINKNIAIGAVADGLGSELYSDIASKIAVSEAVNYCSENIAFPNEVESVLAIIKQSFAKTLSAIENTACDNGHPLDQYDTTLALAIYHNGTVYYGNSGDSGIVVMNTDGTFESITTQQRDENGCVFPLCFGEEYWVFGTKQNVASIFIATDGMYETLFPYLLKGEDIEIYVSLAYYMMSNDSLGFTSTNQADVVQRMESFIASIPGEQVSDDKTVLVMLDDTQAVQKQDDAYYKTPDWAALKKKRDEEYKRKAYPHLFGN